MEIQDQTINIEYGGESISLSVLCDRQLANNFQYKLRESRKHNLQEQTNYFNIPYGGKSIYLGMSL